MKSAIIVAALLSCSLIGGCRSRMSVTETSGETAMTSRTYSEKRDSATSITTGLRQVLPQRFRRKIVSKSNHSDNVEIVGIRATPHYGDCNVFRQYGIRNRKGHIVASDGRAP